MTKAPRSAFRIEASQFHEAGLLKLNCDKALAMLDWRPVLASEETAKLTATWYSHFYNKQGHGMLDYSLGQLGEYENLAGSRGAVWASP